MNFPSDFGASAKAAAGGGEAAGAARRQPAAAGLVSSKTSGTPLEISFDVGIAQKRRLGRLKRTVWACAHWHVLTAPRGQRERVWFVTLTYVGIDDWNGTVTGIGWIDGKTTKDNETAVPGKMFSTDRPATIVCSVRKDGITVTFDGRKLTSFKGSPSRITNADVLAMPNRRALWIGSTDCRFVISRMQLKPVSVPGKVVR